MYKDLEIRKPCDTSVARGGLDLEGPSPHRWPDGINFELTRNRTKKVLLNSFNLNTIKTQYDGCRRDHKNPLRYDKQSVLAFQGTLFGPPRGPKKLFVMWS